MQLSGDVSALAKMPFLVFAPFIASIRPDTKELILPGLNRLTDVPTSEPLVRSSAPSSRYHLTVRMRPSSGRISGAARVGAGLSLDPHAPPSPFPTH